jgi:hypothetical protein
MKSFHKLALVSDNKVWKWLVSMDSPFSKMVGVGEKYFGSSEIDDAWLWIKDKKPNEQG